jgi:hypothetical protein
MSTQIDPIVRLRLHRAKNMLACTRSSAFGRDF